MGTGFYMHLVQRYSGEEAHLHQEISPFNLVGMRGIIREIVVATKMSVHTNTLKLLGCCLETDYPVLVYEYPENGFLSRLFSDRDSKREKNQGLPWKIKLKIGSEISYALAYLHNGFSRPVIHGNVRARDVVLDKVYVAKLTGFYFSVIIPEGEVHVMDAVVGTCSALGPEYALSGRLTEKVEVWNFGVLLLELLAGTGKLIHGALYGEDGNFMRKGKLDPEIWINGEQPQQQEVFDLVSRCLAQEEERPSIVEVATELKEILNSCEPCSSPTSPV